MYTNRYSTLSDAYRSLNLGLAGTDIHSTTRGCHCIPEPLVLEVDRSEWDIPLSKICYSPSKFTQLERDYLDEHGLRSFRRRIPQLSWRECTIYHFKKKPPRFGVERDNCLQYIHYCKSEDVYVIHWRTTELGMRWGGDLAWMSTLFPGVKMILEIPHSYQHLHCWPGVAEVLGVRPQLHDDVYGQVYRRTMETYYPPELSRDSKPAGWGPINTIQRRVIQYREEGV